MIDQSLDNSIVAGSLLADNQLHQVYIVREEKELNVTVYNVELWRNLSAIFVHMDMNRNVGTVHTFVYNCVNIVTVKENPRIPATKIKTVTAALIILN